MFVRKGTVRKQRGGSTRRTSTRRPRRHSDDKSPPRSPYRSTFNGEPGSPYTTASLSPGPSPRIKLSQEDGTCTSTMKLISTPDLGAGRYQQMETCHVITLQAPPVKQKRVDTVVTLGEGRGLVRGSGDVGDSDKDYTAFMYQVREAGKEADHVLDLAYRLADILCSTLFVTVIVGVSSALPLTMFSIGVKYWEDCPKEPRIPVYLIVGGCFGLVKLLASLWRNVQTRRHRHLVDDPDVEGAFTNQTFRTMDTLLLLFLIGWQVAGTYWTLRIWRPNFEQELYQPNNWCDKTVFMCSVYQLGSTYAAATLFLTVLLFLTCTQRCASQ